MKSIAYCVASRGWGGPEANGLGWFGWWDCVKTWLDTASQPYGMHVAMGMDVVPALQNCYERTTEPILAYIQDDVQIFERDWDKRVLKEFQDESVGLVGLGGALGHGRPELYTVPYRLQDLARQDFFSNMRSWRTHGYLCTGERDVAVVDGFAVFVKRKVLDQWAFVSKWYCPLCDVDFEDEEIRQCMHCGGIVRRTTKFGFPINVPVGYYMVWENLCCEVRRQGYRIRLVGIECEHIGGRTSAMHGVVNSDYEAEHKYFYEHNRDMMPYRVQE